MRLVEVGSCRKQAQGEGSFSMMIADRASLADEEVIRCQKFQESGDLEAAPESSDRLMTVSKAESLRQRRNSRTWRTVEVMWKTRIVRSYEGRVAVLWSVILQSHHTHQVMTESMLRGPPGDRRTSEELGSSSRRFVRVFESLLKVLICCSAKPNSLMIRYASSRP